MMQSSPGPDLSKVSKITDELLAEDVSADLVSCLRDAKEYLLFYDWCQEIVDEYIGLFVEGVVGIFLFRIAPSRPDIDEWLWVIVGDLPPTYLTCEKCPNPATALDGYIGAMMQWVDAASQGASVAGLIPVDVPATPENAAMLKSRLDFLDKRILVEYRHHLKPLV